MKNIFALIRNPGNSQLLRLLGVSISLGLLVFFVGCTTMDDVPTPIGVDNTGIENPAYYESLNPAMDAVVRENNQLFVSGVVREFITMASPINNCQYVLIVNKTKMMYGLVEYPRSLPMKAGEEVDLIIEIITDPNIYCQGATPARVVGYQNYRTDYSSGIQNEMN